MSSKNRPGSRPTIEFPAAGARSRTDDPAPGAAAIQLRTGGDEPPLFLLPDGGGEILYGLKLTPHLASGFPVYGFTAPGISEMPLRTIEAMAARLVQMIRDVHPNGPYRIAGWSFGGTLAYEIATQLIGADLSVEFLGSLDGGYLGIGIGPLNGMPSKSFSDDRDRLLQMHESAAKRFLLPEAAAGEVSWSRALAQAEPERPPIPVELSIDDAQRYLERIQNQMLSARAYVAYPIPIPLHLLVAKDSENAGAISPHRNWRAVLPAEQIRSIPVPGTHLSMIETPQAASLGEALSQALYHARATRLPAPEKDYCPMLPIRDAKQGGIPVLCIPGAGGTAMSFMDLANSLKDFGPVEAMQPRGFEGTLVPHATVPAAARAYLQWVEAKYPDGPVHLMGHSFGGWIAFEMARLLRAAGRLVASLTLLDSKAPDHDGVTGREYSRTEAMMELIDLYEQAAQSPLGIHADQIEALDPLGQLDLLSERLMQAGVMRRRLRSVDLIGMARTFEMALRTRYRPENVYPDPVRLVLAYNPKQDRRANEKRMKSTVAAWKRWAPDITVWRSAGNHMTLLRQPHVRTLSDWLSSKLSPTKS